jgi:hypothetical protein
MAVYKKTQIAAISIVVMLVLGGLVALLRPDLLPVDQLKRGLAVIAGMVSGGKIEQTAGDTDKGAGQPAPKIVYRLDLKTGGRVYTDNLKQSDGAFSYTTASGLVVTIPGHEVTAMRKFNEGKEPRD